MTTLTPRTADTRLGTALTEPDIGRCARYGIYGINDDATVLTVAYEGYQKATTAVLLPRADRDQPTSRLPRDVFASVRLTRYHGQDNATPELVARYLMTNYHDSVGRPLTPRYARELVTDHPEVTEAVAMVSFAYFPGDKIAESLNFLVIPEESTDNDDPGTSQLFGDGSFWLHPK